MGIADKLRRGFGEDSLDDIFSEEPVSLDVFVEDKKFIGLGQQLSPIQYEAVRHIEKIYLPDLYPRMGKAFGSYWDDPIRMTNFITLQWGKGSGKDLICQIASARVAYLLLCLKSPQEYFNQAPHSTIHLLNVAPAAQMAQSVFFNPLVRIVRRGWFADKCEPKPGIGVIVWDKNIEAISGHADADSQEGMNLLVGIADEIDAFKSKQEFQNRSNRLREPTKSAEAILDMIKSSGVSRFPTFKSVQISFPRYVDSTIQRLTKEAKKDIDENGPSSKYYVSGPLATWEVNPTYDKEPRHPIKIPGNETLWVPERLVDDYKKDLSEARSKYECKPSPAFSAYFRNEEAINSCFTPVSRPPLSVTYKLQPSPTSVDGYIWEPVWDFAPDFYPIAGATYVMHGDLSTKNDRAGIALAHCVRQEDFESVVFNELGEETTIRETRPFVKVDFVVPLTADLSTHPAREIQIKWAHQLAFELIKRGFNLQLYTFDLFQSQYVMQLLRDRGIESYRVSTDRDNDAWKNLRDLMYSGRISIPEDDLLRQEILRLTQLPNGKIDHVVGFSKDLADAVACAALGAVKVGGNESEGGERAFFESTSFNLGRRFDVPLAYKNVKLDYLGKYPYRAPDSMW